MSKCALITGASGAIGQELASVLGEMGYDLYLHYHQHKDRLLPLAHKLEQKYNVAVRPIKANLGHPAGVGQLLEQLIQLPDILILNAGTSPYGLFTDVSKEEYQYNVELHLTSPFQLTQAIVPHMIEQKWGRIIFISSIWGETGASCEVLYSTLKGAQLSLMKSLAKELAPSGITVNVVSPGAIESNMLSSFSEEDIASLTEEIPLGRLGKPEEVAHAVHFLASVKSGYMTGQILRVNGGWYI